MFVKKPSHLNLSTPKWDVVVYISYSWRNPDDGPLQGSNPSRVSLGSNLLHLRFLHKLHCSGKVFLWESSFGHNPYTQHTVNRFCYLLSGQVSPKLATVWLCMFLIGVVRRYSRYTHLPAPLRNLGRSSCASSRIPAPGSALPHIHTHGCGCGCTPASRTAVPCTLGCSTHTHHWCASCLYKSGQGRGHTVSSFSRYSAVLGRCQEDICHTGSDARFLRHNEGTLEELVPGWSTQGCPGARRDTVVN